MSNTAANKTVVARSSTAIRAVMVERPLAPLVPLEPTINTAAATVAICSMLRGVLQTTGK